MNHRSPSAAPSMSPKTKTSSHVSAASLRALTSAGFSSLGVVFGNASVHLARPVGLGTESRLTGAWRGFGGDRPEDVPSSIRTAQGWTCDAVEGSTPAPFISAFPCPHGRGRPVRRVSGHYTGFNFEIPGPGKALGQAFDDALGRIVSTARQRGALGVIDVSVRLDGDPMLHSMVAITLTGTAIVHEQRPAPSDDLFVATLSAQSLLKLLAEGLFPTTVSFGAVLLAGWTGCGARAQLESGFSTQVDQVGSLLTQARDLATDRMLSGCPASDLVLDTRLTHAFDRAFKSDYRVAAWANGTGVRRFAEPWPADPATPTLTMEQR